MVDQKTLTKTKVKLQLAANWFFLHRLIKFLLDFSIHLQTGISHLKFVPWKSVPRYDFHQQVLVEVEVCEVFRVCWLSLEIIDLLTPPKI